MPTLAPPVPPPSTQLSVRASAGDVPVSADTLGSSAGLVRNLAFGSFWVQLPLSVVSSAILFFATQLSGVRPPGRGCCGTVSSEHFCLRCQARCSFLWLEGQGE
jgi:hypothetical protein